MLRNVLKRLASFASAAARPAPSAIDAADRLISQGRQAEDAGKLSEACDRYREAVAHAPRHAAAHLNLGVGLEAAGDADGALKCYEAVLAIDPGNAYASYNLGKLYFVKRALPQAERHLRAALERKPEFPEAQVVLANLLDARGDAAGAAAAFEIAIRQRAEDFGTWLHYGRVLLKLERKAEAESALKRAVALDPASVDAHGMLSELYQSRGDFAAAARHLEAVVKQRPDWADAFFSYAHALMRVHRLDEAEAALARVIALEPGRESAHLARMDILQRGGRIGEMLELCRALRARAPERSEFETCELFALNFLDSISAEELFARHKAFGERLEKAVAPRFIPFSNERHPDRRLRIGYVAGEFYYHPTGRFLVPLIERHDRSKFEVVCYSVGVIANATTDQLKAAADIWREAKAMKEIELADLVHRDRIDILIDLSGHSGISRLPVFALQPAPVQATWLGYLNTTGLTRIQYRISDANCDPPGLSDRLHTEELVRLPHCQWCYRPFVIADVALAAPNETNGFMTFGSFTQIAKLMGRTLSLWARILQQMPDSRLVIAGVPEGRIRGELLEALAGDGVHSSRVTLSPFVQGQAYFRSFDHVDIALDTSPYSGGTTTCDALWMGVPVLTMPGSRTTSRSATSILRTVRLEDWIAASPEDYVRRAVQFASERETIAGLRRSLRERMRASPLMQEARFARDMEQAYRAMWHKWCSGVQPEREIP
jgi:predicted O-linked N-acetylglucosamine transferase (SPINDLY family)